MSTSNIPGLPDPALGALLRWWYTLVVENPSGAARADRAALRRASDLTAVACLPAYQRVYRTMVQAIGDADPVWHDAQRERIAAAVALLSHVRAESQMSLPEAMGPSGIDSERNPVSALRFRRLLDAGDTEALFSGLRRALPLINYRVDPVSLVRDVFLWGDEVKKRWAYKYAWPSN